MPVQWMSAHPHEAAKCKVLQRMRASFRALEGEDLVSAVLVEHSFPPILKPRGIKLPNPPATLAKALRDSRVDEYFAQIDSIQLPGHVVSS